MTSHLDDRFARAALFGMAFLCVVAVTGPALSFGDDLATARRESERRLHKETSVLADAMSLAVRVRTVELSRLARRPEVDLADENIGPERTMLSLTHGDSSLFRVVAFVDTRGKVVWSEPEGLVLDFGEQSFFNELLRAGQVVDLMDGADDTVVVGVTVTQGERVTGTLVGLVDASEQLSPLKLFWRDVVALRSQRQHTALVSAPEEHDRALALQRASQPRVGEDVLVEEADVEGAALRVVVVREDDAQRSSAAPLRQLIVIALLQLACVVVLGVVLRRNYRALRVAGARLMEHDKLVALGNASALIAHEVKNALNGLGAAASYLAGSTEEGAARMIKGQVDRLSSLARSLLDFARPSSPAMVPFDLRDVANDAVASCQSLADDEGVTIEAMLDAPLALVGDPLLTLTALDNLIRNAVEATGAARATGKDVSPVVMVRAEIVGGDAVVTVEDESGGAVADFETTMFTAFQTTKPKGIGLGLLMARRAVEAQGGTLTFSRTPHGSRFAIVLPLVRS